MLYFCIMSIAYKGQDIVCKHELEMVTKLISTHSFSMKMAGEIKKPIGDKFATLLALYVIYGYSSEGKEKARDILQLRHEQLDQLNFQLRERGYLVKDAMNVRISAVSPRFQGLINFYNTNKETGVLNFQLKLKMDG